jgi:hypothetical protein
LKERKQASLYTTGSTDCHVSRLVGIRHLNLTSSSHRSSSNRDQASWTSRADSSIRKKDSASSYRRHGQRLLVANIPPNILDVVSIVVIGIYINQLACGWPSTRNHGAWSGPPDRGVCSARRYWDWGWCNGCRGNREGDGGNATQSVLCDGRQQRLGTIVGAVAAADRGRTYPAGSYGRCGWAGWVGPGDLDGADRDFLVPVTDHVRPCAGEVVDWAVCRDQQCVGVAWWAGRKGFREAT